MLLTIDKFGGIAPKIEDPLLLPENRAQSAQNCRFDRGGVQALATDLFTVTPAKPGTKKTIFLYDNTYWFHWIDDVDVVPSPEPADAFERVYFAENGTFKVTDSAAAITGGSLYPNAAYLPTPPEPTNALVATVTGGITDPDPTLQETRYYVFVFVNAWGAKGAPSPVSNKVVWSPGQAVTLSTPQTVPAGAYNLTAVQIYRTNTDASGDVQFQRVYETPIANLSTLPTDSIASSLLGEVLPSAEWDTAPTGIKGVIPLPGQVLAGYVDNRICFTQPGFPHAWVVRYQRVTDRPIMGLGAYGTSVVVLTDGNPYLITGTDPENYVMERMEIGLGCVSKRSVVDMGYAIVYASANGLVVVGPGQYKILTEEIFTRTEWQAYKPETISAYLWEGKYAGFYDTGSIQAGFVYDPAVGTFINLNFYATAGYRDPKTEILYLQVGNDIVGFTRGGTLRTMEHKSSRRIFPATSFGWIKVLAPSYPVTVAITYPELSRTDTLAITSGEPERLPQTDLVTMCDVKITNGCTVVYLAGGAEELPQ